MRDNASSKGSERSEKLGISLPKIGTIDQNGFKSI